MVIRGSTLVVLAAMTLGCTIVNAGSAHTRAYGRDAGADGWAELDASPEDAALAPDAAIDPDAALDSDAALVPDAAIARDAGVDAGEAVDASTFDAPSAPPALRVAHLSRDSGAVNVYANGVLIRSALEFTQVSSPREVPEGDVIFRVTRAGTTEVLVERTLATTRGRQYTLTFYGDEVDPPFDRVLELLLLDDDESGLDITRDIRLAVVHVASPVIAGQLVAVMPTGNVLLANDFGFAAVALLPALPSMGYRVGFDAGADGVVDVEFDLPTLVPGTYANVFVSARDDGSVFLLVNTGRGATLSINSR